MEFSILGMDEMEFTEAESNMNDLVAEYQQYQVFYLHNWRNCNNANFNLLFISRKHPLMKRTSIWTT